MKIITFEKIKDAVCEMCGKAACDLPQDVLEAIKNAGEKETSALGKEIYVLQPRNKKE